MNKYITGQEAWNAVYNGVQVEFYEEDWFSLNEYFENFSVNDFKSGKYNFRLKQEEIYIVCGDKRVKLPSVDFLETSQQGLTISIFTEDREQTDKLLIDLRKMFK